MRKDVMITLRITPQQYVTLLETLVKTNKTKSEFIRESLLESIEKMTSKNCRKRDITNWLVKG
jgi:Arc/MetJ-type ribon-helix-helix transcriptional regulator